MLAGVLLIALGSLGLNATLPDSARLLPDSATHRHGSSVLLLGGLT
jgi:hypothetical protein